MRLNVGNATVSKVTSELVGTGLDGKDLWNDKLHKHTFAVELMINDETLEVEGALVVETETDKQWQLIAGQLLHK